MSATMSRRSEKYLREYQQQTISFLYEHDSALALLRMGAGKTVCSLTAIKELMDDGVISRALVLAPKAVALNTWATEYLEWEHLADADIGICWGTPAQREAVLARDHAIVVLTYDNIQWFTSEDRGAWDLIVMDEVTRFNAGHGSKRFKAMLPLLDAARMRWGLTGSFAATSVESMWGVARVVDCGATLGRTVGPFRQRFFTKDTWGWLPNMGAERAVAELLRPITFQPDPSVYQSQLPEVVYQRHEFALGSPEEYAELRDELVLGDVIAASAGVLVGKLQQVASGFYYSEDGAVVALDNARWDVLDELLAEVRGEPVIVWYWFRETGERLRRQGYLDLVDNLSAWNRGEVPVAICHPASGGHGLNAQAGGSRMIWFEHTWSAEMREQAVARLARQGQKNTVFVHDIVGAESVDLAILKAQSVKGATAAVVAKTLGSVSYRGETTLEKV